MNVEKERAEEQLQERLQSYWRKLCRDRESFSRPNFDELVDCFSPYAQNLLDIRAETLITDARFATVHDYLALLKNEGMREVLEQILPPDKSEEEAEKEALEAEDYNPYEPHGEWERSLQESWEWARLEFSGRLSQWNLTPFDERYPQFRFNLRLTPYGDSECRAIAARRLWAAMEQRLPHWKVKWLENSGQEAKRSSSFQPFPTPAGASWKDVYIRFTSEYRVQIRVGDETGIKNFAEMGFEDGRAVGKPTMAWSLLRQFADHRGTLPSPEYYDSSRKIIEKQVQTLRRRLKELFGIQEDPFHDFKFLREYRTKFRIDFPHSNYL